MDLLSASTSELTNNQNSNIKSTVRLILEYSRQILFKFTKLCFQKISQANVNLTKNCSNYGNKKYEAYSFDSKSDSNNRNSYVHTNNNNYKNHRTYNNDKSSNYNSYEKSTI